MHPYHGWPFLTDPAHPLISAVAHECLHGLIALFAVAPIVWRSRHRVLDAALVFIAGPSLDLDHIVVAHSLNARRLEDLSGGRPPTHSLAFAAVLGLAALALTRRRVIAWSVFAIVTSHVAFDAAGGGVRWLYPLGHPDAIAWLLFPVTLVVLALISAFVARALPSSADAARAGPARLNPSA